MARSSVGFEHQARVLSSHETWHYEAATRSDAKPGRIRTNGFGIGRLGGDGSHDRPSLYGRARSQEYDFEASPTDTPRGSSY